MPFTPVNQAKGVDPIITNLMSVIEAQMGDALTWANGGTLPPAPFTGFAQKERARRLDAKYPYLNISSTVTNYRNIEEGSIRQQHTILLEVHLVGEDASGLKSMLETYLRALREIIWSNDAEVWAVGLSAHTPPIITILRSEQTDTLQPRIREHRYIVAGRLTLQAEIWEM